MRLDEIVSLSDILKGSQYIKLLRNLRRRVGKGISVTRIKNQVIRSWKKGMTSRKHYDSLLREIDLNIDDVLEE